MECLPISVNAIMELLELIDDKLPSRRRDPSALRCEGTELSIVSVNKQYFMEGFQTLH